MYEGSRFIEDDEDDEPCTSPDGLPLYGHAAAIRALYQDARLVSDEPRRKPPKGGRRIRLFDVLAPQFLRPAWATR